MEGGERRFDDRSSVEARSRLFLLRLAGMATAEVVDWIVGRRPPPADIVGEARRQCEAMVAGADAAFGGPFPPAGEPVVSGHRDWSRQERIWLAKFAFDERVGRFGHLTPATRDAHPELGRDGEWDTRNPGHRAVWARLPERRRQREILRTSAGPGLSRHHWGTDVDLWSLSPADHHAGGPLAARYRWLTAHAIEYGFAQPYLGDRGPTVACHEERWHWSYLPVARSLLDWAASHLPEVGARLVPLWADRPAYGLLIERWPDLLLDVNATIAD